HDPRRRDRDTQGQSMASQDMPPHLPTPRPTLPASHPIRSILLSPGVEIAGALQDISGQPFLLHSWKFSFWCPRPLAILVPPRPRSRTTEACGQGLLTLLEW